FGNSLITSNYRPPYYTLHSFHFPVIEDKISQGSIHTLIAICVTIGTNKLRSATIYKTANKPPRTVVDKMTGKAIFSSLLRRTQTACATPNNMAEPSI